MKFSLHDGIEDGEYNGVDFVDISKYLQTRTFFFSLEQGPCDAMYLAAVWLIEQLVQYMLSILLGVVLPSLM